MTDTEKLEKVTKYIKDSLAYLAKGQYNYDRQEADYICGQESTLEELLTYIQELG
jgi:hypothetical protein